MSESTADKPTDLGTIDMSRPDKTVIVDGLKPNTEYSVIITYDDSDCSPTIRLIPSHSLTDYFKWGQRKAGKV